MPERITTKELEKRIYLKTIIIGVMFIVGGLISGHRRFSTGIIGGVLTGILNFRLLAIRTKNIVYSKGSPNPFYIIFSYIIRFLIIGAVLWYSINRGIETFTGTCIGLFTVYIAIYIDVFFLKKEKYGSN